MKIVFGVPTLTQYERLGHLLASVEAGTRKPDHYLIVDNGGQLDAKIADGTLVIPSTMAAYMVEHPEANLGVAASWNIILRHAEALNATAIISGDDIAVEPDALEKLIEYAERSPRLFIYAEGASGWSFFIQKPELAQKIGYYDETFWPAYYEDNDYHRRMLLVGEDYDCCAAAKVSHVISATLKGLEDGIKQKFQREFDKNSRYYGIKWGGPPGYEKLTVPDPNAAAQRGGREIP